MSTRLKIFKCFISICLLLTTSAFAQQTNVELDSERMKKSITPIKEGKAKKQKTFFRRDIKFGWDVSNLLIGALSSSRIGVDLSIDYTLKENVFGALEFGNNRYKEQNDGIQYLAQGNYLKVGIDSKRGKAKDAFDRDIFYLGARYAFATFEQRIENYQINSSYWPSIIEDMASFKNQAHWMEAILGFKVEAMKNTYLGLGLRFKVMFLQTGNKTILPATYVPGFGKSGETIVIGFNYSMYYNLPLNYSKRNTKRAN